MNISRTTTYAIHATLELARAEPNSPIPCNEIARPGRMPERFLLHVLRRLVKRGILCSTLGAGGGYYLSRPPNKISLLDIVGACDNRLDFNIGLLEGLPPPVGECLSTTLQHISDAARKELRSLSVADLLEVADDVTPKSRKCV
jgi:Rrf2 family protein